jgi:hypothetical protein
MSDFANECEMHEHLTHLNVSDVHTFPHLNVSDLLDISAFKCEISKNRKIMKKGENQLHLCGFRSYSIYIWSVLDFFLTLSPFFLNFSIFLDISDI